MKIGLLPLYIKLYDDGGTPREKLQLFYDEVAEKFVEAGAEVVTNDFCRIESEFKDVVKKFEDEKVDAIVTVHIAYSPSLESIDVLCNTKLPIIVCDTTPELEFTNVQSPAAISTCHGIHGVMDMCSMLLRRGKPYAIAAGHYKTSDVVERCMNFARLAVAAKNLNGSKVGLIGGAFDGMGDFLIPIDEMKNRFGVEVVNIPSDTLKKYQAEVTQDEIDAEFKYDRKYFEFGEEPDEDYEATIRAGLTVRKCIEGEGLSGFSANFLNVGKDSEIATMPFMEACKAMERGVGYAGEGDALTSAFMGAIVKACPETSFCEIFCPDWKNDMVLLSHMGEMNYRVADGKPSVYKNVGKYINGEKPYVGYARFKGGKGCFVNISRAANDFKLVIAETEMVSYDTDNFPRTMRGWMKTKGSTAEFLENISKNGATHHSLFTYGVSAEDFEFFGKLLGIETIIL